MRVILYLALFYIPILQACGEQAAPQQTAAIKGKPPAPPEQQTEPAGRINPEGTSVESRFIPPPGFQRAPLAANSFEYHLRQLPLKAHNSPVMYYNGKTKDKPEVYDAVVDLPIGNKDLHQCADAIMRLRAEYLYAQEQFDKIHFNFTNGFKVDYSEWRKGKRIAVNGNTVQWVNTGQPSNTYEDFWKYLEIIFSYAGTYSLAKELQTVTIENLKIGDIFIQGGSPGHAVIVVDLAKNPKTGESVFLLAQSYMPAQEIQILKNPENGKLSPWYSLNFGNYLETPEWRFKKNDLKRFVD